MSYTCCTYTWVGNARHGFHLIPLYFQNSQKKYMILRSKIHRPGLDWNLYPWPDPTGKYSEKRVLIPDWFRSGPVWSGKTQVFGLPRRSCMVLALEVLEYSIPIKGQRSFVGQVALKMLYIVCIKWLPNLVGRTPNQTRVLMYCWVKGLAGFTWV